MAKKSLLFYIFNISSSFSISLYKFLPTSVNETICFSQVQEKDNEERGGKRERENKKDY